MGFYTQLNEKNVLKLHEFVKWFEQNKVRNLLVNRTRLNKNKNNLFFI